MKQLIAMSLFLNLQTFASTPAQFSPEIITSEVLNNSILITITYKLNKNKLEKDIIHLLKKDQDISHLTKYLNYSYSCENWKEEIQELYQNHHILDLDCKVKSQVIGTYEECNEARCWQQAEYENYELSGYARVIE